MARRVGRHAVAYQALGHAAGRCRFGHPDCLARGGRGTTNLCHSSRRCQAPGPPGVTSASYGWITAGSRLDCAILTSSFPVWAGHAGSHAVAAVALGGGGIRSPGTHLVRSAVLRRAGISYSARRTWVRMYGMASGEYSAMHACMHGPRCDVCSTNGGPEATGTSRYLYSSSAWRELPT